jgi:iron complex transport system ATP-binding protein
VGQARGEPSPGAALDILDVSARYPGGGVHAVVHATLRVEPAQVVAILGANGAGKSTLLRVAAGLLAPEQGEVRICGRSTVSLSRRELSRQVALVVQSESAATGFSVRDVVAMGRSPHQGRWMRESTGDRAAVDEALERCDLARVADRTVETLSGGEQRRVAIARALAQDPRLLLLDEPAVFLDVRHRLELHDLLGDIVSRRRMACLVATHDLDTASRLASGVVLMREGRIVAAGAPDDVLTPAALKDVLGVEVDTGVHAASGQRYFLPRASLTAPYQPPDARASRAPPRP